MECNLQITRRQPVVSRRFLPQLITEAAATLQLVVQPSLIKTLGSGLIDYSQNTTVAAMQMANAKGWAYALEIGPQLLACTIFCKV